MEHTDGTVWSSLKKAWRLLTSRERWQLLVLTGVVFVQALLEVVGIGAVPAFAGALASPERVLGHPTFGAWLKGFGVRTQIEMLYVIGSGLVAAFALKTGYTLFAAWQTAKFLQGLRIRLGTELFHAYMHAPYPFHLARNPAELVRNATIEVDRAVVVVVGPTITMCAHGLIGTCVVLLMFAVQPFVTLMGITLFAGASYAFLASIRRRSLTLGRDAQVHRGKLIQAVNEGLGGLKEARILQREREFVRVFQDSTERLAKVSTHRAITVGIMTPGIELVAVLGLTLVVALLVAMGMPSSDILPLLALFAAALLRLKQAVAQVSNTINVLRYDHVSVNPIYHDLKELAATLEPATAGYQTRTLPQESIELKDVSFRYPGSERWTLRNVNISIRPGSSIALVGATGAGKSTMADVLLGLLSPTDGAILVDGKDIRRDIRGWQRCIGYIPQSLYIIDDTMRRNIAFGLPEAEIDDGRVLQAARIAQLDEVIAKLPAGLATILGDRGVRLSGGQRQRVCIARALYNDPAILVLDEATSALDNATEKLIVDGLEAHRGNRTLVVIAHRLTTVQHCDRIFLMRDGRVEASGSYDELFRTSSGFQSLVAAEG